MLRLGMAVLVLAVTPALAQQTPAQVQGQYVQAVVAAKACKVRPLSDSDHDKIVGLAMRARGGDLQVGEQMRIDNDARGQMESRISSLGCSDSQVQRSIAFFQSQIAPHL